MYTLVFFGSMLTPCSVLTMQVVLATSMMPTRSRITSWSTTFWSHWCERKCSRI